MRLAYFTNTYPRATDTFIRHEVIGLRKRGFDVFTYSVRKSSSDHDVDSDVITEKKNTKYILPFNIASLFTLNIKTFISNPSCYLRTFGLALRTSRPGITGHFLQLAYFLEAVVLAKLVINDKVQHIHNHLGDNSGTVTLLAAKLTDIPYSITIHGPHIFFDGLHWALDEKTEYSKFISCIGHFCISQMMLFSGNYKYWSKYTIIRCGVDLKQFDYQEPNHQAKKIVYIGRLSVEKGIPIFFESLTKLIEREYDFELTLLGDGGDRNYLEKLAKEMNIEKYVIFKGFVDQTTIVRILKASDILVLPSFAEGIPVSLMEAMAIGVPVIATYVGGVAELVVDQKTGQVVYPADSESLARAIARYIDDLDFCKTISKHARAKVACDFNIENQIDKLAILFANKNDA